jgi:hypothetical protein
MLFRKTQPLRIPSKPPWFHISGISATKKAWNAPNDLTNHRAFLAAFDRLAFAPGRATATGRADT